MISETKQNIIYTIDQEIIEKYSEEILNKIDKEFHGYYNNFLKFAILRFDFLKNDVKIQRFLREIKKNIQNVRKKEDIFNLIDKYLGVSEVEKKQLGEVFTPFALINEMLDTLPVEVWSNPNLKWLDPANGVGNFPAVVVERLMEGLKSWESDEEKRYKHILENMVYVCDISPKNMFIYLNIFDPDNKYKMNYHRGSFLDENFSEVMKNWRVERYDVIVGNPPYQTENKSTITKNTSNVKLWRIFIEKSLKICKNYMCFVTPDSWASGTKNPHNSTNLFNDIFKKMNTMFISFDVNTYFKNIGVNFSYYLIQNSSNIGQTLIKSDNIISILDLSKFNLLPNKLNPIIFNILKKISKENKFDFKMDRKDYYGDSLFKEKSDKYNIPVYCGVSKGIYYSNKKSLYYNIPKVFTHRISTLKMISDSDGLISTNYSQVYVLKQTEISDVIVKLFDTKLYKFLYKLFQYTQYNESITLNQLPKVDLTHYWTEQELYNYFNLTQEEIDLIEKTIK